MMSCEQYRNKMIDYIEGNLSEEQDKEMKNHISQCLECKKYYNEEKLVDRAFNEIFDIDGVKFNSSRKAIMEAIDKDKYGKNNRFKSKNYYKRIVGVAAAMFLVAFLTPLGLKYFGSSRQDLAMDNKKAASEASPKIATESASDSALMKQDESAKLQGSASIIGDKVDFYEKKQVPIDTNLKFNTAWISSTNGSLEASIDGKGKNAQEEGVGILYIKDVNNKLMYEYALKVSAIQHSPLKLSWFDDENLMIINGGGYGTLVNGTEILVLNYNKDEEYLVYSASESLKERIISVEKEGNNLKLKVRLYTDDNWNNFTDKEYIIENYVIGTPIQK